MKNLKFLKRIFLFTIILAFFWGGCLGVIYAIYTDPTEILIFIGGVCFLMFARYISNQYKLTIKF